MKPRARRCGLLPISLAIPEDVPAELVDGRIVFFAAATAGARLACTGRPQAFSSPNLSTIDDGYGGPGVNGGSFRRSTFSSRIIASSAPTWWAGSVSAFPAHGVNALLSVVPGLDLRSHLPRRTAQLRPGLEAARLRLHAAWSDYWIVDPGSAERSRASSASIAESGQWHETGAYDDASVALHRAVRGGRSRGGTALSTRAAGDVTWRSPTCQGTTTT